MTVSTEWWSTFFSGLAIESWTLFENPEQSRVEVDYIAKALDLKPGSRVLDVPCGCGRHSVELAGRGFKLTGVDLAPKNIDDARHRASGEGLKAVFECRDMRDLPWREELDGAFCFGNSFAYLDDDGNAEFLRSACRVLKPGARFVLETGVVAESILPNLEKRAWYLVSGLYFLAERRHDPRRGRLDVEYTFIQGERVEIKQASYRVYTCREVLRLFEEAGFEVLALHGSMEGEPYEMGSRNLLLTAQKR